MAEVYSVNLVKEDGLYCEYNASFSGEGLNNLFNEEVDRVKQQIRLNGFRPGKVPRDYIIKQYGEGIFQDTVTKFVNEKVSEIIQEKGVEFLQECSKIEGLKMGACEDLQITIKGEKMPEFIDLDLESLEVDNIELSADGISADDVAKAIQKIKDHEYCDAPENHGIADKNRVKIDFDGKIDGESFEGGTGKDLRVTIGKNELMPGLEPQILSMKVGDKKECTFVMPETHKDDKLRNKEVKMMMEITGIEVIDENLSDDDLLKRLKIENWEKLEENVRNNLLRTAESQVKFLNRKNLFDKLDAQLDFELPKFVLEKELKHLTEKTAKDEDVDEEKRSQIAKRRIKLAIFLIKMARKYNVSVEEQDIFNYMMNECGNDQNRLKRMIEEFQKNQNFRSSVNNVIIEGKAADLVEKTVKKNNKNCSYDEIEQLYEEASKL